MGTSRNRFSLVELLVVIAIIALLAALLLPALNKAKGMALSSQCQSNQRQCGIALTSYANDFNDWVIASEVSTSFVLYHNLAKMMMGLGYTPIRGGYTGDTDANPRALPFGQVFQCPSLPPPTSYYQSGGAYPYYGNNSNTMQSFGLRGVYYGSYYPGEQQASDATANFGRRLVKLSTLYRPSAIPYMVDTVTETSNNGGATVGRSQWCGWGMGSGAFGNGWGISGSLQLRHSKRGNVWMPDGHVASWGAADTYEFRCPGAGTLSSTGYRFGYTY